MQWGIEINKNLGNIDLVLYLYNGIFQFLLINNQYQGYIFHLSQFN